MADHQVFGKGRIFSPDLPNSKTIDQASFLPTKLSMYSFSDDVQDWYLLLTIDNDVVKIEFKNAQTSEGRKDYKSFFEKVWRSCGSRLDTPGHNTKH